MWLINKQNLDRSAVQYSAEYVYEYNKLKCMIFEEYFGWLRSNSHIIRQVLHTFYLTEWMVWEKIGKSRKYTILSKEFYN